MLKRFFESLRYRYNRIFRSNVRTFISAIDLMQPINGRMTAAQVTAITRLLDVELIRQGKPTYWDVRLANFRQEFSEEENRAFRKQSEGLVNSMDRFGWDFNLSSVMVNREPLFAYNGTHRLGYTLQKNPYQLVPVIFDYNGWKWSQEDGLEYFRKKNLTSDELLTIQERYDRLIAEYSYDIQIILSERDEKVIDSLNTIGKISSIREYTTNESTFPSWFSKQDKKFFKSIKNGRITVVRVADVKKDLSYERGEFHSPAIENYMKSLNVNRYIYTPTITKSIEMDVWMKENCTEIK